MSGRAATKMQIAGDFALSVGSTEMKTPGRWVWCDLLDAARLESGHTPSRKHPEYWDGDIPWIGIKDARENHGRIIEATNQTVTQDGLDNSASRLLPARTVCLSRTASVGYATIMGRPMATSQDFVNWLCSEAVIPEFLMHLFIAEKEALLRFSKGTTHRTIYFPEVKALRVCLPPVNEQRRIVSKVESLQTRGIRARESLEAIPPLLEKLRQSILAAAFRGDLTAEWRAQNLDVEPASVLLERIRQERRRRWEEAELAKMKAKGKVPKNDRWKAKYKEPEPVDVAGLPELPEGWCWVSLGALISGFTPGKSPKSEGRPAGPGETGVLKVSAVTWGQFDSNENKALLDSDVPQNPVTVCKGDILITRANTVELVGAVVIAQASYPNLMLSDKIIRLDVVDSVDHEFVLWSIRSQAVRNFFEDQATGTSNSMRNLSQKKIAAAPVPIPPIEEQRQIADILSESNRYSASVEERGNSSAAQLAHLDQSVLAKAFRGELVPQDPNDEPASVLLERIKAEREVMAKTKPKRKRRRKK